jgi:hypothetical protein
LCRAYGPVDLADAGGTPMAEAAVGALPETGTPRVNFQTDPGRYRRWRLIYDGRWRR